MEAVSEAAAKAAMTTAVIALLAAPLTAGTSLSASLPSLKNLDIMTTFAAGIAFEAYVVLKLATGLLPSELKELTFNVSKTSFPPDDNAPGYLQDTKLKAVNKGWKITPDEVQNFINEFVGNVIGNVLGKYINVEGLTTNKAAEQNLVKVVDYITGKLKETLAKPLEKIVENFTKTLQELKIPLTSRSFEVDATPSKSPNVIEATSIGIIAFEPSNDSYQPTDSPGEGKVNARTKPGSFGGAQLVDFSQVITVGKKDEPKNPQPQDEGGTTWGDPHLVTFDRLKYDHHAVGEFILAKSTDGTFEIQVREASVPASSQVALNTAAAMKVGNTRVAFYVKDFPDSDTTNPLRVDGKPTVIQGGSLSLPGGGTITQVNQASYIGLAE